MKTYDLYLFAPEGKLIRGWYAYEADGDEAAIMIAEELAQQVPLELWREDALVKRWEQPEL